MDNNLKPQVGMCVMNNHSQHCLGDGCSRKESCLRFTNLSNAEAWTPIGSNLCRDLPNYPSWVDNWKKL